MTKRLFYGIICASVPDAYFQLIHSSTHLQALEECRAYGSFLSKVRLRLVQVRLCEKSGCFQNGNNQRYKAFFAVLFYTGRRKGEVLALTPEDVKLDRISFTKTYSRKTHSGAPYTITNTKNEKKAATPICKPLQEILKDYDGQSPFLFGGDNPFSENAVRCRFNGYCAKAGLEQIRIHDLRHSFVSMLIHLGANMMVVADLIGDTVEQVMKTYGHLYEEDKLDIISKI